MIIKSVEFVTSAIMKKQYPIISYPEIAFFGRSNVGKSSLINILIGRKNLARISSKPGCTKLINFFFVNNEFSLVDLPGYGYAKVSLDVAKKWKFALETYFRSRKTLKAVVFIIDVRRGVEEEDIIFINWFRFFYIPMIIVLTKVDKISKNEVAKRIMNIKTELCCDKSELILFSAKTGVGRKNVWLCMKHFF